MTHLSVVIPCYNAEKFLAQAIRSVLAQTHQDFEIIVVDDGSTDSSAEIIKSTADPRIRYLWQSNGGPSKARNTGVRAATGQYLAFLDADDLMLPQRLASQLAILEAQPSVSVVGSAYLWIDENGHELAWPYHSWQRAPDLNSLVTWLFDCPFVPSAVMLRREAWCDVQGFDEDLLGGEDWNFWTRLVITGHRMTWHQEVLCLYRRSAGSLSEDAERMSADVPEAMRRIVDRPDFPPELLPVGRQALAIRHIDSAKRLYRSGQWDAGKVQLEQAIALRPDLIATRHGLPSDLENEIVTGALDPLVKEPFAYLQSVLAHLPANAGPTSSMARQVVPHMCLELFIRGLQQKSYHLAFRQYLPNLLRYPTWLLSYGGMVIIYNAIVKRGWRSAAGHPVAA